MFELPVLTGLLVSYGYLAIFAGVILGGEVLLLAAGFLAAQGYFNVYWVIVFATLGVVLIDIVWYLIGRTGRKGLINRLKKYLIRSKEKTVGLDKLLKKHAGKTILMVRFVYGVRAMVLIMAGALKMKFGKFLLLNIIGSIVWATVITFLGYFFGESWNVLQKYVHNTLLLATLVITLGIIILLIVMFAKKGLVSVAKEGELDRKKKICYTKLRKIKNKYEKI